MIKDVDAQIIHLLLVGMTPCTTVYGLPDQWPEGHVWSSEKEDVTCEKCLAWIRKYDYERRA